MAITITGRHISVTKAIKNYAREKVGKLDKFHRGIDTVRLTLDVEHDNDIAEAIITAKKVTFVVHVQGDDMYAVIDKLVDKAERQLRRHKGKLEDRRTRARKKENRTENKEDFLEYNED